MRSAVAVALLAAIAGSAPGAAAGQWRDAAGWGLAQQAAAPRAHAPVGPALLSLALPGAGQHVLDRNRKWLYLGLEVAAWGLWLERRASAFDFRDRYRDYAWEHARVQSSGRVDGDFDYFERISHWGRSGTFDADPAAPGVQPEQDPATYNGSIWSLASQLHLPPGALPPETDPAYQSALAYYESRAYGPAFLWDWTDGSGSQQEFARLIDASDRRFGHAATALGVVIANHLLSAVDAYILAGRGSSPARLRVAPDHRPGARWIVILSLEGAW